MTSRGHLVFFLIVFLAAPLSAQQTIQDLEKRLDDLTKQLADVRHQLDQLKSGGQPAPAAQPSEDLTAIQTVAPSAATAASATAASKVFNPDISGIGDPHGKAGQPNPYEFGSSDARPPFSLDEAEVAFQAYVDPYAKANFFLSVTPSGIEVEEGYATFVTLPYDLTAKAGKMK